MATFIIRRIIWTIPVILLVIFMTFVMMKQIGGNPFRHTEKNVPPAIQANLEKKFNLDKPWWQQYAFYVKDVANGWAAVLQPPGWTPEKTERLRPLLSNDENA